MTFLLKLSETGIILFCLPTQSGTHRVLWAYQTSQQSGGHPLCHPPQFLQCLPLFSSVKGQFLQTTTVTVSTSLKFDLLSEVQKNSNTGLQNFLPVISKDSANGKKHNTSLRPPDQPLGPKKCDCFAGGEDVSQARSDSSHPHGRAGAQR